MQTKLSGSRSSAFTLVEMLAAIAVLSVVMVLTFQMINNTSSLLRRTQGGLDTFQEDRVGFQQMVSRLSQATLRPSWAYNPTTTAYVRQSSLQFLSGQASTLLSTVSPAVQTTTHAVFFQAPLGYSANSTYIQKLPNALNVCGYWLQYGSDAAFRPKFLGAGNTPVALRYRYRLMEMCQPSENFSAYVNSAPTWYTTPMTDTASTHVLAENIIALVILPENSPYDSSTAQTLSYSYDSTAPGTTLNQLPPMVQITMVALDEASALRVQAQSTNQTQAPTFGIATPIFQTATNYQTDLNTLETNLTALHLKYNTFSDIVTIPQAKWSQ